jgi:hypothetical protein
MERGALRLVNTTELLGRKCSGSGLENRDYGCGSDYSLIYIKSYLKKLFLQYPVTSNFSTGPYICTVKSVQQLIHGSHEWNVVRFWTESGTFLFSKVFRPVLYSTS